MSLIKRNQNWLPDVFSDLFSNDWMLRANATAPAINIAESEADYRIEVAAPGMTKDDFVFVRIFGKNHLLLKLAVRKFASQVELGLIFLIFGLFLH